MKLEYRYGQIYLNDLQSGDMIPICGGDYSVISTYDIDENGCLKTNITISNKIDNTRMSEL